ncbi:MAG TPA: Lrp/AsnC family transcriptional regulator [Gaiellales bacterium]|jgi:Lrp/AsnC family transcriptional regulator for asnA, asnC and gidA|nr:Lrp/AsnC family transcriptional regulator [Gaiellales bacterium]
MKLDPIDRKIIESLQADGRTAFTALARETGVSEAAVRARVRRLKESGVIEVVAVTNPLMVGFDVMAMVGIQANSNLEEIADVVSAWDETSYVVILSGSFDLMVEIVCADNQHLLKLVQRIREVPGVKATETFMYLDLHKQTFAWGTR